MVIIDLFALGFDGKEVAKHIRLRREEGAPIIVGLSDKPNLLNNDDFDRIFMTPISTNDLFEVLNYCSSPETVDMKVNGLFHHHSHTDFR